jgi:exosortase/archaeosortase family protein
MIRLRSFNDWFENMDTGGKAEPLLRLFLLQCVYQAFSGTAVYRFYIETLTVRPSVALIQMIVPQDGVAARGARLLWPGGGISVYSGCDGVEVMQLLLAAFVAVSGRWRQRLLGVAFGLLLIYLLNQARIVGLYFAARHDRALFELLHGLAGPLIIAVTTLFFA